MSNYKVTTPKELFQLTQHHPKQNSFFNHLSSILKTSLMQVCDTFRNIPNTISNLQISSKDYGAKQVKTSLSHNRQLQHSSANIPSTTQSPPLQRQFIFHQSKKQKLKQKKQQKSINFQQFQRDQQQKINQSFIRKRIQTRKALNRSLRKESLLLQNQQLQSLQDNVLAENLNNASFLNESLLDVSDVESNCDFSILKRKQQIDISGIYDNQELQKGENYSNKSKFYGKNQMSHANHGTVINSQVNPNVNLKRNHNNIPQIIDADEFAIKGQSHQKAINIDQAYSGSTTRKQVKKSQDNYFQSQLQQQISRQQSQRQQWSDRLITKCYNELLQEQINAQFTKLQTQEKQPLKQAYKQFILKNFHSHKYMKNQVQKQYGIKNIPLQAKQVESIKPVNLNPTIQKRKLYVFTKQWESKISVAEQLKKGVMEDKQRQIMEQIWQKEKEEKIIVMQQEMERLRKQKEEKLIMQEQERKRLEVEMKKQHEQLQKQRLIEEERRNRTLQQSAQKQQKQQLDKQQSSNLQSKKQVQKLSQTQQPNIAPFSLSDIPTPEQLTISKKVSQTKPPLIQKKSQKSQKNANEQQKQSKPTELTPKPSQVSATDVPKNQDKSTPTIVTKIANPFLQPAKKFQKSLLQELVNSKRSQNPLFLTNPSQGSNSPPHRINLSSNPTPNPFMSPLRVQPPLANDNSHYSNLDSSMCQESESNINPTSSQAMGNVLSGQNLNGSFLNNSFNSSNNNMYQQSSNNSGLFSNPAPGSLFGNLHIYSQSLSNKSANQQTQPTNTNPFGQPMNAFQRLNPMNQSYNTLNKQQTNNLPSFMQNNIIPTISPKDAASLFSQKSPSKNQPAASLFGPTPTTNDKRTQRLKKSKDIRIK